MRRNKKCAIVARYIVDNMTFQELWEFTQDSLYQDMKNTPALEDYMEEYGLTERDLEELGRE